MKAMLTFQLPEERLEHLRAVKALDAFLALNQIRDEVFRPARKHGYTSQKLNKLLENEAVAETISLLEDEFSRILDEYGVDPNSFLE